MTQTTVDQIDLLAEVYRKYTREQGLPFVSADEQDFNELTDSQVKWIEAFIIIWDEAQ
tara:strand:- start:260 stop:433 length:174 start_codon:yes stop_codon:yes gene_type:complete